MMGLIDSLDKMRCRQSLSTLPKEYLIHALPTMAAAVLCEENASKDLHNDHYLLTSKL